MTTTTHKTYSYLMVPVTDLAREYCARHKGPHWVTARSADEARRIMANVTDAGEHAYNSDPADWTSAEDWGIGTTNVH